MTMTFAVARMKLSFAIAMTLATAAGGAAAQTYPDRPLRFIVPFVPGGATDIMARTIAAKVNESWRQPVVVDNRAGGGGTIGPGSVRRTGMASAPPTKSEPTGMASCRIGLVVRLCVGMQCNSKRYIEGDAVGAASPAPIPDTQATRSIRTAPRWVLNQPPLESKATLARSAPASRRVRFLICQGPGSLRRHWRGPAGRRVRSQPPWPRPRITPSPGPASRAGPARRPGRRRRPSHPRSRR